VRKVGGGVLLLIALLCASLGGFWAYMKAAGAEVDICGTGEQGCISGWYFAGPLLFAAVVFGLLAAAAFRGGSGSTERLT
jgi:hypothetical protein